MGCDEACAPGSPGTRWGAGLSSVPLALGDRDPRVGEVSLAFLRLWNGTACIFLLIPWLLWVSSVKRIGVSRRRTLVEFQSSFILRLPAPARWALWGLGVAQNDPVLKCHRNRGYQEPRSHLWNQNMVVFTVTVLSSRKERHSEEVCCQTRAWAWPKALEVKERLIRQWAEGTANKKMRIGTKLWWVRKQTEFYLSYHLYCSKG